VTFSIPKVTAEVYGTSTPKILKNPKVTEVQGMEKNVRTLTNNQNISRRFAVPVGTRK
jgi:hypothetical protein